MPSEVLQHGALSLTGYMDPDEKTHHSVSAARPLPVLGSTGGTTGSPIPTTADLIGLDAQGNLYGATGYRSIADVVPIDVSGPLGLGNQALPQSLFRMTTRQAGATQQALIFPTTITTVLPQSYSGNRSDIKNSSNVCGGVVAPSQRWDSILLDFAAVGQNAADSLTVEIARVKQSGTVPDILASVVLTASTLTLAASVDPFLGSGHSAVTWRFFDVTAITANSQLGDVLQSLGGTSGNISQLILNCRDVAFFYVQITAFSDGGTRTSEVTCVMTPKS